MIFVTFTIHPNFHNHILIVMIYSAFPLLMLVLLLFQSDVMMMICKTQVKPFDVLIKNGMAVMTSVDCATQMVDECQVKQRKEWHTTV